MIVIGRLLQMASTVVMAFAIYLLGLAIQQQIWWSAFLNLSIIVINAVLILNQEKIISTIKAGRKTNGR